MPVSFSPAKHQAASFDPAVQTDVTPISILRKACPNQHAKADHVLQSSFGLPGHTDHLIRPCKNGFVHTVAEAYNLHRALIIRPDDVWLAILTQFNFFVNGNAELLRSQFVSHEGKKELVVEAAAIVDFGQMALQMTDLIQKNISDPLLRAWIMPDFSTTTLNDKIVSSMVMMATLKAYFSYEFSVMCGIPRVTLEGEKADWEKILSKLEKLKEYGVETIAWYHLLVPVISRFVQAFDNPDSKANLDFWQSICHYSGGGSGPTWLCGWITAFCVFNAEGKWIGEKIIQNPKATSDPATLSSATFLSEYVQKPTERRAMFGSPPKCLTLDQSRYHYIDTKDIPSGYAEVDVVLNDNGVKSDTLITAGLVGTQISSSGDRQLSPSGERDTVRPVAGWWMFTLLPEESRPSADSMGSFGRRF